MPRRDFEARSVYRVMRHPIYRSFLGLIWFTPAMTLDHALLTGLWTACIYVGSVLKDQRLLFYLGESYEKYMQTVPGYPLIFFGPLARRPVQQNASGQTNAADRNQRPSTAAVHVRNAA